MLGPQLRLPTPRPKVCFTKMAFFLKGIAVVHRHHTFMLYDLCKVLVEEMFTKMIEPAPTGISIIEVGADPVPPTKKRRRLGAKPEKPKGKQDVNSSIESSSSKRNVNVVQDIREITLVEENLPQPEPETFGDEAMPVMEKGYNLGDLATLRDALQTPVSGSSAPNQDGRPQATHDAHQQLDVVPEEPYIEAPPVQKAPAKVGELGKRGHSGEDSINTSTISLLSGQKRRKVDGPVKKRARLPMKIFIKGFADIIGYARDPAHLRKLKASESWKDGIAALPSKSVKELLNSPILSINEPYTFLYFNLSTGLLNARDRERWRLNSPHLRFRKTDEMSYSNGAGPSGNQKLGVSPGLRAGSGKKSGDPPGGVRLNPGLQVVPEEAVLEDAGFEEDVPSKQGVKRVSQEEGVNAKRHRWEGLTPIIVSPDRLWDRARLAATIKEMWNKDGSPICFYDLCPKTVTSVRIVAKVMSALLDLHLKQEVFLEQEVPSLCTPILIYRPGTEI